MHFRNQKESMKIRKNYKCYETSNIIFFYILIYIFILNLIDKF